MGVLLALLQAKRSQVQFLGGEGLCESVRGFGALLSPTIIKMCIRLIADRCPQPKSTDEGLDLVLELERGGKLLLAVKCREHVSLCRLYVIDEVYFILKY